MYQFRLEQNEIEANWNNHAYIFSDKTVKMITRYLRKDLRSMSCFFSLLSIRLKISAKVNEKSFQFRLAHASQLFFSYCSLEIDVVSGSPLWVMKEKVRESEY